jgi:Putative binding domain, N-terminal
MTPFKASVGQVSAALRADVRRRGCEASTLSPASITFSAFASYKAVFVTTPRSDCRWTAASNADWLRLDGSDRWRYDPRVSGSGSFSYSVLSNNSLEPRSGNITVSFTDGASVVANVAQERVSSCSYVVTPDEATYSVGVGGLGAFDVFVTPSNCQWTATASYEPYVKVTAGTPGTGTGRINYAVYQSAYRSEFSIQIAGLSGANPPAVYRIHVK